MEITKREILFSTIILTIMIGIGIWLSNIISFSLHKKYENIICAIQIHSDQDKFDYIGRTEVGDFLAEGTLYACPPISIPDIEGQYMIITKEKQKYTMHTRTTTDSKGHVHTHHYWSWDHVKTEEFDATSLKFLNKMFSFKEVSFSKNLQYLCTIKESATIRYIYRVYPTSVNGTMNGIAKNKKYNGLFFRPNTNIDSILKHRENTNKFLNVLFWIFWIALTGFAIYGFYYLENNWLEDE